MNKKINSYKAVAALTRAFFEAYTNGILDGSTEANNKENKRSPQAVKQAMLEHYEEINHVSCFDATQLSR